ncbi:hypothetical protein Bca52824_074047 [Brassica carinata]|uniref:Uncharacterized protein n=1 Tax=Brassica carinata TaxID=52824 RepID=A0A8X7QC97_BRACI|nr:hypothetical protein Bca52824_074047 [Brassica carinata]
MILFVPGSDCIASKKKNSETHIQELEEELKLLKNHSNQIYFEEAGALATADGNQELKLKCHLRYYSSGLL